MEKKSFQIVMDPSAQRRAKTRAGQLNLTIGQYCENLISAMEIRLKTAYDLGRAQHMVGLIDDRLLKVLLQSDKEAWTDKKLKNELFNTTVVAQQENLAFEPKITVHLKNR